MLQLFSFVFSALFWSVVTWDREDHYHDEKFLHRDILGEEPIRREHGKKTKRHLQNERRVSRPSVLRRRGSKE